MAHPSSITSVFIPVIIAAAMENAAAFQAGQPLSNLTFVLLLSCGSFGGTGNTLSLCLDMYTAKSEKIKAMRDLMTVHATCRSRSHMWSITMKSCLRSLAPVALALMRSTLTSMC